jgi:Ca-activated chloride channel family protein
MRRLPVGIVAPDLRTFAFILFLRAAFTVGILALVFADRAAAQSNAICAEGLMRRDDAGTGTLLLKTAVPGCYLAAPRVAADVDIDIAGPVARTKLTQRFENPSDGWIEGIYVFPLPETAAVDTLKMKIGDRFIEGQIKERQEARQIYEAAKSEGKRASLVEEERPNIFTNQVANIGPHETIVVQIEYQQSLRFDAGRYRLRVPLVVAPRYSPGPTITLAAHREDSTQLNISDPVPDRNRLDAPVLRPEAGKVNPVSLTIRLEAGFPLGLIESDSHRILVVRNGKMGASIAIADGEVPADRDFTLSFAPTANAAPTASLLKETAGDADYYLALVVPPASANTELRPRETVFVLDNSGSMAGESIRQAKASLLLALDRLHPADRFNVIRFDNTMTMLFPASVDATIANVAYAKGFVSNIQAAGGTEMLPALVAALKDLTPLDESRLRQVIFLTDGEVGNEAQLFSAIGERLGRSRLFTVGIGSAPNAYFMSGAARAGRGTYTYIGSADQVAPRMAELFTKLEHPAMTNLSARWPDGLDTEAWPNPLPDLYAGEPVVVTVKASKASGILALSGNIDGKSWQANLDLSLAEPARGIEKLWARNKIAALDESRVRGADPAAIDTALLGVALSHHLTSRLTSLVAVDVTPSRPLNAPLLSGHVALNLPDGWDFDKVFGETPSTPDRHASATGPANLMMNLVLTESPIDAVKPQDSGLVLPQGGTDSRLMLLAGVVLLLFAAPFAWREQFARGMRP